MTARDEVMARIRTALGGTAPADPAPESAAAYRAGLAMTQDAAAIVTASADGSRRARATSSTCRARRWTSSEGMSIRTGHAS